MTPRPRPAALGAAALLLAASLAAVGCRRASRPPAGEAAAKRPVAAVVPMGTTHEFWKSIHAGAAAAGREVGVEVLWKGPLKEDDRNEQVRIVETLVASGIDALVLTPIDDRALVPPVEEARAAGIPVVVYNSPLRSDVPRAYVATDNRRGGELAADRIGTLLRGRGSVLMLRCTPGVEGTRLREDGFLEALRARYPAVRVVSSNQYAGTSTEGAYQAMEALLGRFGSVDAVYTPNESTTFGALRALADHGLAGRTVHVGFDTSAKLVEGLRSGALQGLVLQDPFAMGYRSVEIAAAILRGRPYDAQVDTGVVLATPETMDRPEVRRLLVPETGDGGTR